VAGPPGEFLVNGRVLGEINSVLALPVGRHACQFRAANDRRLRHFPCRVGPDTRNLVVSR
jgi:hypothetical protein